MFHEVCHELWRRYLDSVFDSLHYGADGVGDSLTDLRATHLDRLGQTRDQIASFEADSDLLFQRPAGTGGELDLLGHALADAEIILLPGVLDDLLIDLVPGDADGLACHDAAKA